MKKILSLLAVVLLGAGAVSAQFMCSEQGTVFTYTMTNYESTENPTDEYTSTVEAVDTDASGVISARIVEAHKVQGNIFGAEMKTYSTYTYNPATELTILVMSSADDAKKELVDMIVESARMGGQPVSDSQIEELSNAIRVKGDLSLELPATPDPAAKVANKSLKMSLGPQTFSTSLWNIKYEGFEDVEVPAGKFENCMKVSFELKQTSPEATEKKYCTAWFAKGIGIVKSIDADKKGKVLGEEVLKSIKK